jgi:hypothetical protein
MRINFFHEDSLSYLNKALSSENPEERASTAAGVPMFRSANIARYRSNKGRLASTRVDCNDATLESETSSSFDGPAKRFDVGGAGSTDVKALEKNSVIE